jgi:hypothetical protein
MIRAADPYGQCNILSKVKMFLSRPWFERV